MRRVRTVATAALLMLAILFPAGRAGADRPTTFKIDQAIFNDLVSNILTDACGTAIEGSLEGHIIISLFFDKDGNITREIDRYSTRFTLTNVSTGASTRFVDSGPDLIWDIQPDGTATQAIIGRSVTGSGVIGRVILTIDYNTFEVLDGPHFEAGKPLGDWVANACAELT